MQLVVMGCPSMNWFRERLAWLPYTRFRLRDLLFLVLVGVVIGACLGYWLGTWRMREWQTTRSLSPE